MRNIILEKEIRLKIFNTPRRNFPIEVGNFYQEHFPSSSRPDLEEALLQLEAQGTIDLEKEIVENFAGSHTAVLSILSVNV